MHQEARVVIIGSGIAGSSIAYHLTEMGWRDIVVLDQGPLISGTTSHAPGLVGQLRSSVSLTRMLMYSVSLYKQLYVNGNPGYFPVGSLRLASTKERLQEIKRQEGFARGVGLQAELLGPRAARELFPLMGLDGVEGALYLPTDGAARALILAQALADGARQRGAGFYPEIRVTGLEVSNGAVRAVLTTAGTIRTEIAVVAAGVWSPRIGRMAGVPIPLLPMQHQYALTGPLSELEGIAGMANLRDPDRLVYFRQDGSSLVIGGYERDPAPLEADSIPQGANPTVQQFDEGRFASLLASCRRRVPALTNADLVKRVNGLESFTPDGEFILGESPAIRGFWAACGFCAHGVSGAGGVGRMLAEWIVDGEPSLDLWHMDFRRFGGYASSRAYISKRVHEVYSTYYDIFYPGQERESARRLRLSPLYQRLEEQQAVFGEKAGWERPNYFKANEEVGRRQGWTAPRGWASRYWSPAVGAEHQATRDGIALFDETSFSKFDVIGPGALVFLQHITDNQMDQPVGTVTYTQMLNPRGGIECDLTVARLGVDQFRIITGTAFGTHDHNWLRKNLPQDGSLYIRDVTSNYCCIGIWGPRTRDLMHLVSEDDFSNSGFPYMTARPVIVGEIPALAVRVTYVGELGWELYTPMEYGLRLWDTLWEAGKPLDIMAAGYWAIDSLRLEKGYRYWSADIHSEYNPYEAGLGFAVKLQKGDFRGREALERIKKEGIARKLCCMTLTDPTAVALGGEPIFGGKEVLGRVTSGGYGYTVRASIAYGYLPPECAKPETAVEVQLFGERIRAKVVKEPLYDPGNTRIKM